MKHVQTKEEIDDSEINELHHEMNIVKSIVKGNVGLVEICKERIIEISILNKFTKA